MLLKPLCGWISTISSNTKRDKPIRNLVDASGGTPARGLQHYHRRSQHSRSTIARSSSESKERMVGDVEMNIMVVPSYGNLSDACSSVQEKDDGWPKRANFSERSC